MCVCFIGHRTILENEELISSLRQTVIDLIGNGVTTFLFGSMSAFDDLSWKVVTEVKAMFPNIKRVYVRSSFQHIDKSYEEYLLESYEETYFPPKLQNAGKYSYVMRNYEMIDKSTYCVFYYNANYVALNRKTERKVFSLSERKSGTKIAYNYALKKNKKIINLFKQQIITKFQG